MKNETVADRALVKKLFQRICHPVLDAVIPVIFRYETLGIGAGVILRFGVGSQVFKFFNYGINGKIQTNLSRVKRLLAFFIGLGRLKTQISHLQGSNRQCRHRCQNKQVDNQGNALFVLKAVLPARFRLT